MLKLSFDVFTKTVRVENLKEGMRLAEGMYMRNGKVHKMRLYFFSPSQKLFLKKFNLIHSISESGLKREEVMTIKNLKKRGKLTFEEVLVYERVPFSPFITLGILLTFLGNFFKFLSLQ